MRALRQGLFVCLVLGIVMMGSECRGGKHMGEKKAGKTYEEGYADGYERGYQDGLEKSQYHGVPLSPIHPLKVEPESWEPEQFEPKASKFDYPIRLAYIDRINNWWPPEKIAAGLGVPGYAESHIYNFIALAFWTNGGPVDMGLIWANAITYFSSENPFGTTTQAIQQSLKKRYNDAGIKIMISAFGATDFPTTAGVDPEACATKLGQFVQANNLDGVDIDWEDNSAMEAGKGEQWLITFSKKLREMLPNHIITHAPQAPYFKEEYYKNGAYITVDKAVGSLIDFYNVQFYNQGNTKYNTYTELMQSATGPFSGTALYEIIGRGVPSKKLVIGKPVTTADASNTGWVNSVDLGAWVTQAYNEKKWFAGIMFWQFVSDTNGQTVKNAAGNLIQLCSQYNDCN